ncbi:MAG: septum formation protein Maf [Candidatus Omnitrophica bacterium]|nr:septum formation protein Maf [Candidatus Omnitrophota bacterium]
MLYLASRSPRRRDLLKQAGIPFRTVRSSYKETHPSGIPVAETAVRNAVGKCRAAAAPCRALVLGADTVIEFKRRIIGKPLDRAHARRILKAFSGNTHIVWTGVALEDRAAGILKYWVVASKVTFRRLTAGEIEDYLDTGEYRDKAGGYGYQKQGRALVQRIQGSPTNIIGLPMERLTGDSSLINFK